MCIRDRSCFYHNKQTHYWYFILNCMSKMFKQLPSSCFYHNKQTHYWYFILNCMSKMFKKLLLSCFFRCIFNHFIFYLFTAMLLAWYSKGHKILSKPYFPVSSPFLLDWSIITSILNQGEREAHTTRPVSSLLRYEYWMSSFQRFKGERERCQPCGCLR